MLLISKNQLEKFRVNHSLSLIKLMRKNLDGNALGQNLVKPFAPNCMLRLDFTKEYLNDDFSNAIFTDEKHWKLSFHRMGNGFRLKPTLSFPYNVLVWAGISQCGKA